MRRYSLPLLPILVLVLAVPVRAADWPQWLGVNREGVWRETGLVEKFPKGGPKVLWRVPIGSGYSGPAVVDGKVYVMDRERTKGPDGKPLRATRKGVPGNERVVCLDATNGKIVWKHEYDCPYTISYGSGPRCTPLVEKGRVYALGAMGDLCCLDTATGKPVWSKNVAKEYKVEDMAPWGYAASPLIDGELLYTLAGGDGSAIVALNKETGKEVWKALTTEDVGYSPPMIYKVGGKRQLIVWLSDTLNGLDPATGKVYWSVPYPGEKPPSNVTIVTPRLLDDVLYVSTYYNGGMAVKLDADKQTAKMLWQCKSRNPAKPDGLHILMATPFLRAGHIYGVCAYGELRCLEIATGKEVWNTLKLFGKKGDCATAFLTPLGDSDRFVIFTDVGDLILADINVKGYTEIDRAKILDVTAEGFAGRTVVWCQPAYANRCVFARNDKEMVCVSLAAEK
jgi:outer membrane protein assembly factor BamB